jgi:phage baseplate assembly protein W
MNDDGKEFLGRGWAFPFAIEGGSGRIAVVSYEEAVRQSILLILETAPGERVMRPEFGCGIHELVFQVIDTALIAQVEQRVRGALTEFEPRIDLLDVNVDQSWISEGRLEVAIDFRVRTTNQRGNLVYPFYFREGT